MAKIYIKLNLVNLISTFTLLKTKITKKLKTSTIKQVLHKYSNQLYNPVKIEQSIQSSMGATDNL
jgi:hypothetical protein